LGQFHDVLSISEIYCTGGTRLDTGRFKPVFDPVIAHVAFGNSAVFGLARYVIGTGLTDFFGIQLTGFGGVNYRPGMKLKSQKKHKKMRSIK
jgi:hypothetical protein